MLCWTSSKMEVSSRTFAKSSFQALVSWSLLLSAGYCWGEWRRCGSRTTAGGVTHASYSPANTANCSPATLGNNGTLLLQRTHTWYRECRCHCYNVTLLNLLLIEGAPVSSYRRSFSSPLPRQNHILPGPREDGNSMTFNNASAAPLLHILGHGIMYNVQSIMYKVRSCCSLCEDGQGRCRVLAADVGYTMVMFCQALAAQTVALCLQIQSENILGHKSECVCSTS